MLLMLESLQRRVKLSDSECIELVLMAASYLDLTLSAAGF